MRLAFVHKRYGCEGGTERILHGLARGLGARGHEVDVFCKSYDPSSPAAPGVRIKPLRAGGPGSLWRTLALFVAAKLATQRTAYDLVVHFGRTGPQDIYRSGGGCHRRWLAVLGEAKGFWHRVALRCSLRHRFLLWHERSALRSAGTVVVPSEQARGDLIDAYGEDARRVHVLANGVDLDRFHPRGRTLHGDVQRRQLGLAPSERVLLFVGSDYWRKGLDRVLVALAELAAQGEMFHLLVAGGDRRQAAFSSIARDLGILGQVSFLGEVTRPELLYASADLLVLPTRYDPFANVTLEALASGVPVLTSRVNGAVGSMPESAGIGLLSDDCSGSAAAAQISAMMNPACWGQRSVAARSLAERFSAAAMITGWEHFLREQATQRRRCG